MNRRDFMRTGTFAAMAGGALNVRSEPINARPATANAIRVGVVGCGGRGTGAAVQALSEALTVNVEVAAPEIEIDAQSLAEAMPTPEPVNLGPLVELLRSVNMNLQTIAQKEPPPPREIPPAFRVEEQADGAFIVEPVVH